VVAIAIIFGLGLSIVAGIFAGQISASGILFVVLFMVVGLPLLAYILTRKITVFGTALFVSQFVGAILALILLFGGEFEGAILALFGGGFAAPGWSAEEAEVRQRLADCEARIMELKEGRS